MKYRQMHQLRTWALVCQELTYGRACTAQHHDKLTMQSSNACADLHLVKLLLLAAAFGQMSWHVDGRSVAALHLCMLAGGL